MAGGLDSVRPPGRPAKLGAEQLSQLSEYIDQQSRLAIGDDCKVLIFKRISSESLVWPMNSPMSPPPQSWGFLDNQSLTTSEAGWAGAGSFAKNFQLETILTSWPCCLPNVDVWFQTKPGLVRIKHDYPTVGQAAVAPELFIQQTTIRVRLSLRCRLPCNRDNGSLAQSSGKPGGDEAALGTDCSTNKAGSSCGGDHGRRRMAYHGMCG